MPPTAETWKTFGDALSKNILTAVTDHREYRNAAMRFHARLFLIVRGLNIDQLRQIFGAATPQYLESGTAQERDKAMEIFEQCHGQFEDRMVKRIRAYAKMWIESPGGSNYAEKYTRAK